MWSKVYSTISRELGRREGIDNNSQMRPIEFIEASISKTAITCPLGSHSLCPQLKVASIILYQTLTINTSQAVYCESEFGVKCSFPS